VPFAVPPRIHRSPVRRDGTACIAMATIAAP